jgi:fatty-acyl-CoA synthase
VTPSSATTLCELLEACAARGGGTFNFPERQSALTVPELAERAAAIAGGLRARGVGRGSLVGAVVTPSPETLATFFGILRAGAAVTPLPPPSRFVGVEAHATRLEPLLATGRIRTVVAPKHLVAPLAAAWKPVRLCSAEELSEGDERPPALPQSPTDWAVVQFTSGSTSAPKGVVLNHDNVLAGLAAIRIGAAVGADDVNVFWVPLYHDMGLMGMLSCLTAGSIQYVWTPESFIGDVGVWLSAFARVRGSIYCGPSFSFRYMLEHVDDETLATLDLSAWRVAFNGAEPIDADVLERFVARFAPAGFRRRTMFPVYGMAEATLAVSFPALGEEPVVACVHRDALANGNEVVRVAPGHARARAVVAVGSAVTGLSIRVVDADGRAVREDRVGEIEVAGRSVMLEYLGTAGNGQPRLRDGWLATGDLGFVSRGRLYVTGRIKQMIVVNGTNYYPEDAEAVLVRAGLARAGHCAAVALTDRQGERLALIVETTAADPNELAAHAELVERAVRTELGLDRLRVVLVPPRTVLRTTTGKLRRLELRERLRRGELRDLPWVPRAGAASAGENVEGGDASC